MKARILWTILEKVGDTSIAETRNVIEKGQFAKGNKYPEIQAVLKYLDMGDRKEQITNNQNIDCALKGEAGTWIVP